MDIFTTFEAGFLRKNLVDSDELRRELQGLLGDFDLRHGGTAWRDSP